MTNKILCQRCGFSERDAHHDRALWEQMHENDGRELEWCIGFVPVNPIAEDEAAEAQHRADMWTPLPTSAEWAETRRALLKAQQERDHWKANHDEQVRQKRALTEAAAVSAAKVEADGYRRDVVIEYARNVDAIWHQPRQDTNAGQATHAVTLANGFALLRAAITEMDAPEAGRSV